MTISAEIIALGAFNGLAYAIMGAGLVLIYRASGVINFAHGEIGAFAGAVLALVVMDYHWNWYVAFVVAGLIGAALGALCELGIIRRLFTAPRLIVLVATIGLSQLIFALQLSLPQPENVGRYPVAVENVAMIGPVPVRGEHFIMLAFVTSAIIGLAIFLNRTPWGLALRAAADEPDAAELAGVSTKRVSTMAWAVAGLLAAMTFVVIAPTRGVLVGSQAAATAALGPGLLVRALVAAMAGGLRSFPLTMLGGLVLGVIESVVIVNVGDPGAISFVLLLLVFALVLLRRDDAVGVSTGILSLVPRVKPIPARLMAVPWVRRMPQYAGGAALALAIVLPLVVTRPSRQFMLAEMLGFAVVGVSLVVLTGWAGQLSLGHFALVGVGAMVTAGLGFRGMPIEIAMVYAVVAAGLVALLIGAPALRMPGLFLAVTTLAFALAAPDFLFTREILSTGSRIQVSASRPTLFGLVDLGSQRSYYYFSLVVLAIVLFAVGRLRRTGIGRSIVAVRDNEDSAAAFTVSPVVAKLTAFGLSGCLAGLGGALLAGLWLQFATQKFVVSQSLLVLSMAIIGGLGSVYGALLGAVYIIGLPALLGASAQIRMLTGGIGLLLLLMYAPGGLAQVMFRLRDILLARADRLLERAEQTDGDVAPASSPATTVAPPAALVPADGAVGNRVTQATLSPPNGHPDRAPHNGQPDRADARAVLDPAVPVLRPTGITVRFGGLTAVDDVSIVAYPGETLGLIGSNGAGKSTLMNVISGFVKPDEGRVELLGHDVTHLPPHRRAGVGAARLFQDARLFGSLTVREVVKVALEGRERSELVPSLLGLPPAVRSERRKVADAAELIDFLGLGRYADSFISTLSTGTRRITELACIMALEPRVLLLDEPTAGIAQRETEAFGPLIGRVKDELDATLVLIEHDMPLVMALSGRIYCMSAGKVIAEGTPLEIRSNPSVIAAYLGTDERAIARSGLFGGQAPSPPSGNGQLGDLTRRELIEMGRERGHTGLTRRKKADLVRLLEET